jgi:hypothetical protein
MPLLARRSSEKEPSYSFEGHSDVSHNKKNEYTQKYFIYLNTVLFSIKKITFHPSKKD